MKTKENSIKKSWSRGIGFFLALAVVIAGCTSIDAPVGTDDNGLKSFEDLNINVKYAESYDQTTIVYSREWPSSISQGLGKVVSESDGEFMVDYERVHEVVAFDEDGYMSTYIEFLEGDSEMGMPEDVYKQLSNQMPAESNTHDPLTRMVLSNGTMKYYGKSGALLHEYPVDEEKSRVNPEWLNALSSIDYGETNTNNSVRKNIESLESAGISFSLIDGVYAKYEMAPLSSQLHSEVSRQQYVRDLRNGNVVFYAEKDANDRYINVTESRFENIKGLPILTSEVYYDFAMVNGKWGIAERTVMTRQNIEITKSEG